MRRFLAFLFVFVLLAPVPARAADASPDLRRRSDELLLVLKGEMPAERIFAPAFLAQVPPAQVKAVVEQLRQSYGPPTAVGKIEAKSETAGTVTFDYPKALVRMEMALDAAPSHLVVGLLITGAEAKGDSADALVPAFKALPGRASFAAARLGDGGLQPFAGVDPETPMAVGSAFKLFILAELAREVKAGERHWSDVVPLDRHSLPSGTLQQWPLGSPLTVHSLAALMISQSDNSAADTLLAVLGREKVERLLPALGVRTPERDRPFLSTREAFLLKLGDGGLRARWIAANEAGRRALLDGELAKGSLAEVDARRFAGAPLSIGEIEWFASAGDIVRALDWIRRNGDRTALDILAINPGLPAAAHDYAYVGYKGGSEAGVLNMSFLLRRKDGSWAAVAATWNNPAAAVDQGQLTALVGRLLTLLR